MNIPTEGNTDGIGMNRNVMISDEKKGDEREDTLSPEAEHHIVDESIKITNERNNECEKGLNIQ